MKKDPNISSPTELRPQPGISTGTPPAGIAILTPIDCIKPVGTIGTAVRIRAILFATKLALYSGWMTNRSIASTTPSAVLEFVPIWALISPGSLSRTQCAVVIIQRLPPTFVKKPPQKCTFAGVLKEAMKGN